MRKWLGRFCFFMFILIIAGCSHNIKEEKKDAIDNTKQAFSDSSEKANEESKDLTYYLPFGMKLQEESPNNIIFKKGGNSYILFYNQNEKQDSDVLYNMSERMDSVIVDQTFKEKNQLGYLIISKVKKNLYEVIVGVGGIKMTTESKKEKIADNAEIMMKIVKSVKYKGN